MIGLTHTQAVTLAHKVRVNAVLPGWIYTMPNPEEVTKEDHEWHPSGKPFWYTAHNLMMTATESMTGGAAGRVGTTNDIAQLCLFLADGKKSGFITGQDFTVDGGVSKKLIYPE